jgi:hypothetical protein
MKEVRLICPTAPKLSHETERCLKTKLQIYTVPRNGTYILLPPVPLPPCRLKQKCQMLSHICLFDFDLLFLIHRTSAWRQLWEYCRLTLN